MPSYYDSTKKKPGAAKVRYNKGGKTEVKKPSPNEGRKPDGLSTPFYKIPISELHRMWKEAKVEKRESYFSGGKTKVENGHDVTFARGSGAARPQKFRKNG